MFSNTVVWLPATIMMSLLFLMPSCGDDPLNQRYRREKTEYEIPEDKKEQAMEMLVKLCEASNPKSDEEPEDMITEARKSVIEILGTKVDYFCYTKGAYSDQWYKVSEHPEAK